MKLAIMTKSTFFVEEDKILSSLFDEGMDNLHLFKPGSSPMYSERLLTLLPEDYLRKITVHDHYYLKQEYDLAGIHIDDPLAPVPDGYKGKYSRTCTDLSMLKEMKKKSNYVFLKNIFDCIEFKDEKSSFSLQQLENGSQGRTHRQEGIRLGRHESGKSQDSQRTRIWRRSNLWRPLEPFRHSQRERLQRADSSFRKIEKGYQLIRFPTIFITVHEYR